MILKFEEPRLSLTQKGLVEVVQCMTAFMTKEILFGSTDGFYQKTRMLYFGQNRQPPEVAVLVVVTLTQVPQNRFLEWLTMPKTLNVVVVTAIQRFSQKFKNLHRALKLLQ